MLEIKKFITSLDLAQRTDSNTKKDIQEFKRLINLGVKLLNLPLSDIQHAFGASQPTVERWLNGKSTPYYNARFPVYRWLQNKAEKALGIRLTTRKEGLKKCDILEILKNTLKK